ncbi:MAG: hypothetical protein WD492_15245 [Alkalispirochaeta sp.]
MKDALLHLTLYVLFAVACAVAILSVLVVMGASLGAIVPMLGTVALSGWVVGMVPATLRLLRRGRRPVTTATMVACITAGMVVVAILTQGGGERVPAESRLLSSMSEGTVVPGRVYQGREYSVLVDRLSGNEVGPVIVADHTEDIDARFRVHPEGYWDRLHNELVLPDGSDINLNDLRGFGVPSMPAAVRNTAADVRGLVETAAVLWSSSVPFVESGQLPLILRSTISPVLVVLVLTLLLTAVWTPLRLTRWPLLNVVVGLAYLRAVTALPTIAVWLMRVEIVTRWMPGVTRAELVLLGGIAMFLVLALVALLVPSLPNWRHNMHFRESGS